MTELDFSIHELINWDINEWPVAVRCQHKDSDQDSKWYFPERTCKNVDNYGDNIGGWKDWDDDRFGFACSECGYVLRPDEMGTSPLATADLKERVKISYCPHCGAKVVK